MCGTPERRRIGPTSWIRRADVGAWPTSITGNHAAPMLMALAEIAGRHRRGESSERVRDLGRGPAQDRVHVTNAGHSARVVAARSRLGHERPTRHRHVLESTSGRRPEQLLETSLYGSLALEIPTGRELPLVRLMK